MISVIYSYHPAEDPSTINLVWLPLEIGIYGIVVDFWFYWHHRLMHEVDCLWKYHRTHHLIKHPNPLLTFYSDAGQELFDNVIVPHMTYYTMRLMGMPMGFYEWWICQNYVFNTEFLGHSGLRVHANPPSTLGWLLRLFNADIVIEDHDLHHRRGSKKSFNYGKQTRLWDRVFGTCHERIESVESNVDFNNPLFVPIY
jgi:sterol desaturase/sphingolipid hydroxylase (fatty acid hydroxylase superfamily)